MAPIIEVSEDTLRTMKPEVYALRPDPENPKTEQVANLDNSNWIVIPHEFTNGRYSASINPARLAYSPAVARAGKKLELNLGNTSRDSLGREFVGNIRWQEAMNLLDSLGVSGVSTEMNTDYLRLLDQGRKQETEVYDVSGRRLDPRFLSQLFDDSIKTQSPWREEWFDTYFKQRKYGLDVLTENKRKAERLDDDTLMEDRLPGISLGSLLENPTEQGLPRADIEEGNLSSWHPRDGAVARLDAGSYWAYLGSGRYPLGRDSCLGVRSAIKRDA